MVMQSDVDSALVTGFEDGGRHMTMEDRQPLEAGKKIWTIPLETLERNTLSVPWL